MYKMVLRLDVGSRAEDFALTDYRGDTVRLSDLTGKGMVLFAFFRGGFDKESIKFLRALKDSYQKIRDAGCEVLAITPELPQKAATVVSDLQLPFNVACDTDMKVAKMYDVYNPAMNWCWPAAFILDRNGVIQYSFRGASPPNTPPMEYILRKIEQMKKAEEQQAPAKSIA